MCHGYTHPLLKPFSAARCITSFHFEGRQLRPPSADLRISLRPSSPFIRDAGSPRPCLLPYGTTSHQSPFPPIGLPSPGQSMPAGGARNRCYGTGFALSIRRLESSRTSDQRALRTAGGRHRACPRPKSSKAIARGIPSKVPYVRTSFLSVPNKCFHFDLESGKVRLSLRNGEWTSFHVRMSPFHRDTIEQPDRRSQQLHLGPTRAVLTLAYTIPEAYRPNTLWAFDTNETSLDGIRVAQSAAGRQNTGEERANLDGLLQTPGSSIGSEVRLMRLRFPDIPVIQRRHFNVRRRLSRKKAHDRRVGRNLLRKVGMRERHRVASRLHELSKHLVTRAVRAHAALALEDLTRMPIQTRASRRLRRRLSSWPRGELHCQIAYKAQDRGVPIYWVNPYRTSKTCPRCGEVARHRNRVGPKFECAKCGWSMDRQFNAAVNIDQPFCANIGQNSGVFDWTLTPFSMIRGGPSTCEGELRRHGRSGWEGRDRMNGSVRTQGSSIESRSPCGITLMNPDRFKCE